MKVSWMPGVVSSTTVRMGRRFSVTNTSPTIGFSRLFQTLDDSIDMYSRRS
jgi:hypothetical protein